MPAGGRRLDGRWARGLLGCRRGKNSGGLLGEERCRRVFRVRGLNDGTPLDCRCQTSLLFTQRGVDLVEPPDRVCIVRAVILLFLLLGPHTDVHARVADERDRPDADEEDGDPEADESELEAGEQLELVEVDESAEDRGEVVK